MLYLFFSICVLLVLGAIYSFNLKNTIILSDCVTIDDYTTVYGHGRQTLINGVNFMIYSSYTILLSILLLIAVSYFKFCNTTFQGILLLYITVSYFLLFTCAIYFISEIKHLSDGIMTNDRFFIKYFLVGCYYYILISILIIMIFGWIVFLGTIIFSIFILYLGMADLFQTKDINKDKKTKIKLSDFVKAIYVFANWYKFIFNNDYRSKANKEALIEMGYIAKGFKKLFKTVTVK